MPLPKLDPFPVFVAGPQSVKCNECDWEGVWVLPEEINLFVSNLLLHIQQHGIEIPVFTCQVY